MAFLIKGGTPLYGTVRAQGAKNAVLPMLFATLLCRAPVTLYGVPDIGDVRVALEILEKLGVRCFKTEKGGLTLCAEEARPPDLSLSEAKNIRASAYLLGAALARFGEGKIPYPGGCAFGVRPLDYHKAAFLSLGAAWEEDEEGIRVSARQMKGSFFALPYPSVGATVNFIFAALGASGESTLYGYAKEQHVLDLVSFLRRLGARIVTEGDLLHIQGGLPLSGGEYTVTPDAIEAGTYLIAAAATGGEVTVERIRYAELSPLLVAFGRMNIPFRFSGDAVTVYPSKKTRGTEITAAPYPGFPTDLHPPFAALLSCADGGGVISDLVWQDRYLYVEELKKMGANILRSSHGLRVFGSSLHGERVRAPDLRGGAALLVAALAAQGETSILGEESIARGYENLPQKLFSLGASVSSL